MYTFELNLTKPLSPVVDFSLRPASGSGAFTNPFPQVKTVVGFRDQHRPTIFTHYFFTQISIRLHGKTGK